MTVGLRRTLHPGAFTLAWHRHLLLWTCDQLTTDVKTHLIDGKLCVVEEQNSIFDSVMEDRLNVLDLAISQQLLHVREAERRTVSLETVKRMPRPMQQPEKYSHDP